MGVFYAVLFRASISGFLHPRHWRKKSILKENWICEVNYFRQQLCFPSGPLLMTSLARRCPALCPGTARINVFWIGFVSLLYPPKYKCVAVSVSDGGYSVVPFRPLRVFDRASLQSYPQLRFNITHHGCALFGLLPPTNWNHVRRPPNSYSSAILNVFIDRCPAYEGKTHVGFWLNIEEAISAIRLSKASARSSSSDIETIWLLYGFYGSVTAPLSYN